MITDSLTEVDCCNNTHRGAQSGSSFPRWRLHLYRLNQISQRIYINYITIFVMNTDASLMYKSIKKTTTEKRMAGRFSNVDDCFCFSFTLSSRSLTPGMWVYFRVTIKRLYKWEKWLCYINICINKTLCD